MIPDSIVRVRIWALMLFAVLSAIVWVAPGTSADSFSDANLKVTFFDIGQGDAIFIETPGGVQVLVDGGPNSSVLRELGATMSVRDRTIDMVVSTHPDKDHIGGLVDVLDRYQVGTILLTENKGSSAVAAAYSNATEDEGADVVYAHRGQVFELGASTTLEVLFPESDTSDMESNASSIVLQLKHGDIEFMLTGDSPKRIEEYLVLMYGEYLESEVLKVGHHGSRTSTSELFLDEVQPQFAVISASAGNSYGHPHVEVTDALFNARVETLSTAEEGSITFVSDGTTVKLQ